MEHRGETFVDEEIPLGETRYVGCTFEGCRLVYGGEAGVQIEDCDFEDTRLELTEEAGNTLSFLQNLYHGFGEDGQAVVENLFDQIREGRIEAPGYPDNGHDA
jgi:hypothetical protein